MIEHSLSNGDEQNFCIGNISTKVEDEFHIFKMEPIDEEEFVVKEKSLCTLYECNRVFPDTLLRNAELMMKITKIHIETGRVCSSCVKNFYDSVRR